MHRIGVVGISWRHPRAETLGTFTIPRDERDARIPALAQAIGAHELVYLATCNRVEVAFALDSAMPIASCRRLVFAALTGREPQLGEAEHSLRVWHGEGAAEHLFLMTAGLDSARVGESEVAGQVRDALDQSRTLGLLGPRLEKVFAEAFKVAKQVRPITEGRNGRVSLSDLAMRHVSERLARTPGHVALVGVSPMTEQCARGLAADGVPVIIVNRTLARAEDLAREVGGTSRSLEEFRKAPDAVEAIILATGAREPVFKRADLERMAARSRSGEPPLVVDMGVPANVNPDDAAAADMKRIGMEDISDEAAADRDRRLMDFADARAMVDAALTDLRRESADRLVGPMIALMRRRYRDTAIQGVERLFQRDLAGVGEAERNAIRRWAETMAGRFAHAPSVGLRDLVFHAGPSAVEAFFEHSEPELVRMLHERVEDEAVLTVEPAGDES